MRSGEDRGFGPDPGSGGGTDGAAAGSAGSDATSRGPGSDAKPGPAERSPTERSPTKPREVERSSTALEVRGVIETTLCCGDLDAAEAFYTEVLGFETWAKDEGRHLFFRCGDAMLLLFNPDHTTKNVTKVGGTEIPLHGTRGSGHVAFRATRDEIERWKERLAAHDVAIESVVEWPEGGRSIFFRDPDGNCLEFVTPETWGLAGSGSET